MIYQMWHQELYKYALQLTGDYHDAHDILYNCYDKWLAKSYNVKGELITYLRAAVRNEYYTWRYKVITYEAVESIDLSYEINTSTSDVKRMAIEILSLGTERQMKIIVLWMQGYSYKEMADVFDVKTKTIENTLRKFFLKARSRAKPLLCQEFQDGW